MGQFYFPIQGHYLWEKELDLCRDDRIIAKYM